MKVFISSTYEDLKDYRKAAIRAVEGKSYQVFKIEVFGERSNAPQTTCLEEVEQCDLFIGIYALRYGSIPKGENISINEMEYDCARKLGKNILCFILDEENQPWLRKWIDDGTVKSKLITFKKKIEKHHICYYFTTPDDLQVKVSNALSYYIVNNYEAGSSSAINLLSPPHCSTLPAQTAFFGRDKEREIIAAALSPESRTWGILIDGPGGIGKTALAIKAAYEAPDALFDRRIFITAKVRDLTPEGEKPLTDFTRPTYLAMLDELAKELGIEDISRLALDERTNALRLALAGKKALVVFDNLETLPEEERARLFQFLSRLPEGNKAIVTSRRRTDVDARIVRLDRLLKNEAMQLIAEHAEKYPLIKKASQTEREELYDITHGNPLFIRWIAGQLGRAGSRCRTIQEACTFIDKAPKGNDPLEYIFGDLLGTFTENETKVLAALTHFTQPARLKWLAQVTGLPERTAETALDDLTDRAILTADAEARTYFLPPLAAKFIKTRRPEAVNQTGDALTDRAYALAMQYGGGSQDYENFPILNAEWDFISAALPRLLKGDNTRLQEVSRNLRQFLNFTGRWDDLLWFSEQYEACALAANDKENAGWRAFDAGWGYYLRKQHDKVLACAARAEGYWKDSTPRNKAFALRLRGLGHRLNKDYPDAIEAFREVLEIHRSISPESIDVAIALNSLATAEQENKEYKDAERDYLEALRIAKNNKYDEGIANYTGNLAALALDRGQGDKAENLAREALKVSEKIGRQELIASDCYRLAIALLKQNRHLDEALLHIRRAVEIYTNLRMKDNLQEAQELLAEIEQALDKK